MKCSFSLKKKNNKYKCWCISMLLKVNQFVTRIEVLTKTGVLIIFFFKGKIGVRNKFDHPQRFLKIYIF